MLQSSVLDILKLSQRVAIDADQRQHCAEMASSVWSSLTTAAMLLTVFTILPPAPFQRRVNNPCVCNFTQRTWCIVVTTPAQHLFQKIQEAGATSRSSLDH